MGKKKSRDKQVSKGERRNVSNTWTKLNRLDYRGTITEEHNKYEAFLRGKNVVLTIANPNTNDCLLYTSPSPRDFEASRMPSSA